MAYQKRVNYVVDKGDDNEEIYDTKRQALARGQVLADERHETILVYRWVRGTCGDMELDEGGTVEVQPQVKSKTIDLTKNPKVAKALAKLNEYCERELKK